MKSVWRSPKAPGATAVAPARGARRRRLGDEEVAELATIIDRAAWSVTTVASPHDLDDMRQELWARLLARLPAHNPMRGSVAAFATVVVGGLATDLVRERSARKRGAGRIVSLNTRVADGDGGTCELGDLVGQRQLQARVGTRARCATCRAELRLDVDKVTRGLDAGKARLVQLAMRLSVTDAARAAGVPRSTLRDRLRRLAGRICGAGLDGYLGGHPVGGCG